MRTPSAGVLAVRLSWFPGREILVLFEACLEAAWRLWRTLENFQRHGAVSGSEGGGEVRVRTREVRH